MVKKLKESIERDRAYNLILENKVLNQMVEIHSTQTGNLTSGEFIQGADGYYLNLGLGKKVQIPLRVIDTIEVNTLRKRKITDMYGIIYINQNHPSMEGTQLNEFVHEFG